MKVKFWFVLFGCSSIAAGQYVGAAVCGSCHPEQMKQQAQSEHARALRRPAEHALAQQFPAGLAFHVTVGAGREACPDRVGFRRGRSGRHVRQSIG